MINVGKGKETSMRLKDCWGQDENFEFDFLEIKQSQAMIRIMV